jgi:hypothetical protein
VPWSGAATTANQTKQGSRSEACAAEGARRRATATRIGEAHSAVAAEADAREFPRRDRNNVSQAAVAQCRSAGTEASAQFAGRLRLVHRVEVQAGRAAIQQPLA